MSELPPEEIAIYVFYIFGVVLVLGSLLILLHTRRENNKAVKQLEELIDEIRNIPSIEPNDIIEDEYGQVPVARQVLNILDKFAAKSSDPESYKSRALLAAGWNADVDGEFVDKPERAARALNRIIKTMLQSPLSEGFLIRIEYKRKKYWMEFADGKVREDLKCE